MTISAYILRRRVGIPCRGHMSVSNVSTIETPHHALGQNIGFMLCNH